MVIRALVLAVILLVAGPVTVGKADESRLQVLVGGGVIEQGRMMTIRLASPDPGLLENIDLSPLEADFAIHKTGSVARDSRMHSYVRQLQLYPRRSGHVNVPSLGHGIHATQAIAIDVAPATDRQDRAPITVHTRISEKSLWLKQGFYVRVDVETNSEIVDIETPPFEASGFKSFVLPPESNTVSGRTIHRLGWAIFPLEAGSQRLRLPPLMFKRDGVVTHRFFLPAYAIEVKSLPSYIPVTIPVGRVNVMVPPRKLIPTTSGELSYLAFRIEAEGMPAQFADFISQQLTSSETTALYPAELQTEIGFKAGVAVTRLDYRVPFVATGFGSSQLPTMRVQVFDPASGTLVTQQHALGTIMSVPRWLQVLLTVMVALVVFYFSVRALHVLRAYWRKFRIYREATRKIRNADNAQDIRQALIAIARAEAWPANITVDNWARQWTRRFFTSDNLVQCLNQLQALLYGKAKTSVAPIQVELLSVCYRRLPLLKVIDLPGK
jgi:hypothetical protein